MFRCQIGSHSREKSQLHRVTIRFTSILDRRTIDSSPAVRRSACPLLARKDNFTICPFIPDPSVAVYYFPLPPLQKHVVSVQNQHKILTISMLLLRKFTIKALLQPHSFVHNVNQFLTERPVAPISESQVSGAAGRYWGVQHFARVLQEIEIGRKTSSDSNYEERHYFIKDSLNFISTVRAD